jgi:hypothetical protein
MSNAVPGNASKVAPEADETSSSTIKTYLSEEGQVPTFGELVTQLQTPSSDGGAVPESFDGTNVDLSKSPFPVNNDLFEGLIHILMRDLPGNKYTFDGEKEVLWEIQIQVSQIRFCAFHVNGQHFQSTSQISDYFLIFLYSNLGQI